MISRLSPGLLPEWFKRCARSRVYQEVRWQLSAWATTDVRTLHLLGLLQLAVGLVGFWAIQPAADDQVAAEGGRSLAETAVEGGRSLAGTALEGGRSLAEATGPPLWTTDEQESAAAVAFTLLLVPAQWGLAYAGHAQDNKYDTRAAAATSAVLAALVGSVASRLGTAAALGAAALFAVLAVLGGWLAWRLTRTMGFQSYMRLGSDPALARVHATMLGRRTLHKLDVICTALALLFSAMLSMAGWAPTASQVPWLASLGLSAVYALAAWACSAHDGVPSAALASLPLGLGAALAATLLGAQPAVTSGPPDAPAAPALGRPYWLAVGAATLLARGAAAALSLRAWCAGARSARRAKPELPEELKALPEKHKKALNRIAKGEVVDLKVNLPKREASSGGAGRGGRRQGSLGRRSRDRASDGTTDRGSGVEDDAESRRFLAFNLQLRTLRWGWQNALGVDQMVSVRVEGPGLARDERRSSVGDPRLTSTTGHAGASPAKSARSGRFSPDKGSPSGQLQREGASFRGSSAKHSPNRHSPSRRSPSRSPAKMARQATTDALSILRLSVDRTRSALHGRATRLPQEDELGEESEHGPADRNVLIITFRQPGGRHVTIRLGCRNDASLAYWYDGICTASLTRPSTLAFH